MSRENEIVAIFENETATGKKVLKGKTIRDIAAGTKVILWPVDRTENPKRPAYRLEVDTYVPPAKTETESAPTGDDPDIPF